MTAPKRHIFTIILGFAVFAALFLPYLRPRPTTRYTVTDLGVLPGDQELDCRAGPASRAGAGVSADAGTLIKF